VRVRAYEESDLEELQRIHAAQGFAYAFPDLSNPLFMTKLVLVGEKTNEEVKAGEQACLDGAQQCCAPTRKDAEPTTHDRSGQTLHDGSGQGIVGAALLRLTAEAYLLLDPKAGTPRQRWEWLLGLHAVTVREAARRGLEDVHAWLPPEIAAKFGKRLRKLGWVRDDEWTPYCRRLR